MQGRAKFILFLIGLAVAAGSSATSFYFLYSSVIGTQNLVYQPNPVVALIEMVFLALAIGTCIVASEVYYRYLKSARASVHGQVFGLAGKIEIEIKDIHKANLKEIPESCRGCVYWESPNDFEKSEEDPQKQAELETRKREWFEKTLEEFGSCGKIVYHDGKPVAYAQYSGSERLPNVNSYESKSVGKLEEGVVFLSCLYIADETMRDRGIGEQLLQNIIEDLRRRGFKAMETFACRTSANNPSGPMTFYIKNGFHIKDKTNAEFPLMRLFL